MREHFIFGGIRQRAQIGKALEKALVIRDHGSDLRLLQHDLGEPDAVGIARVLPRQVVTAVCALPGDDARSEALRIVARNAWLVVRGSCVVISGLRPASGRAGPARRHTHFSQATKHDVPNTNHGFI